MPDQKIIKRHVTECGTIEVNNGGANIREATFNVKFAAKFREKPDVTVSVTRVQLDRDGEHPVAATMAVVEATTEILIAKLDATQHPGGLVNSATFEYSASGYLE